MGGLVARLFRRRRPAPPAALADDGSLTTVGRAEPVPDTPDASDGAAVAAIAASGVDLSQPLLLRHVLLVRDPAAAEGLTAAVRAEGYDVRLNTVDGGLTWIVVATETALLTPVHAARARARFTSLASRHGAAYDGWEAAAPPA
ncbi:MAG TPA: ribonuclease E inhibitor RraB [Mycobacteriales bacterium]|nr:ribonuclease E inhibitor RraB [Mycobacteriales bacterium]